MKSYHTLIQNKKNKFYIDFFADCCSISFMYEINIRRIVRICLAIAFVFAVFYALALVRIRFSKKESAKGSTCSTCHAEHDSCDMHLVGKIAKHQHLSGVDLFVNVNAESITSAGNIHMDHVTVKTITLSGNIYGQDIKSQVACIHGNVALHSAQIHQLSVGGVVDLFDCNIDTLKILTLNHPKNIITLRGKTVCGKIINLSTTPCEIHNVLEDKSVKIEEVSAGGTVDFVNCNIGTLRLTPLTRCPKHVIKLKGNTICNKIINASLTPCEIEHEKTVIIRELIEGKRVVKREI